MAINQYGSLNSGIILIFFLTISTAHLLSHRYCKRCRFSSNGVANAFIIRSHNNYRISRGFQNSLKRLCILRVASTLNSEIVNKTEPEKLILWRYDFF